MSNYIIYKNDELYHYGVPGMRWGHRKAYSVKGTMWRALAGAHGVNEKAYRAIGGNRTANLARAARKQALKNAEKADAAKAAKKASRGLSRVTRMAKVNNMTKSSSIKNSSSHKKGASIALKYGLIGYSISKAKSGPKHEGAPKNAKSGPKHEGAPKNAKSSENRNVSLKRNAKIAGTYGLIGYAYNKKTGRLG